MSASSACGKQTLCHAQVTAYMEHLTSDLERAAHPALDAVISKVQGPVVSPSLTSSLPQPRRRSAWHSATAVMTLADWWRLMTCHPREVRPSQS